MLLVDECKYLCRDPIGSVSIYSGFPLINLFLRNPQHQHSLGEWEKTQNRIFHIFTTPDRISSAPESLHSFKSNRITVSIKNSPSPTPTQGCSYTKYSLQHLLLPKDHCGSTGELRWFWMEKLLSALVEQTHWTQSNEARQRTILYQSEDLETCACA